MDLQGERRIRGVVFDWLRQQTELHGDVLPFQLLRRGLQVDGQRIPLLGPQGIFKPKLLDFPLSITTAPSGPYDDAFSEDGTLLRYRYRGEDPMHRDNVGLRRTKELGLPLCYFHGVVKGRYLAAWPVFVQDDHPSELTFDVVVDDARKLSLDSPPQLAEAAEGRRRYLTSIVHHRLHQRGFRERVLQAYREHCAICRLRHRELLDSAHIIPDHVPDGGDPVVPNGLALCRFHHAAFDRNFIGIRPDRVVEVRPDILREQDGPMLRYGLQEVHGSLIFLPRRAADQPDPERLARRYEQFRKSA